jgi:hypothetical protein
MGQGIYKLEDSEFWSEPWRTRKEIERPIFASRKSALLFDAPKRVAVDVRKTLPVLVSRVGRTADERAASLRDFAILVASDLDSGRGFAAQAVEPPVRSYEKPEPGEVSPTAMAAIAFGLDARQRLDLPWRKSRLSLSLIVREQLADALSVELGSSPGAFQDPEVEKHRLAEQMKAPFPAVHPRPSESIPAYGRVEGAPQVPEEPGIVLAGERVVKASSKGPLILRGAFRLSVPAPLVVAPGERARLLEESIGDRPLPAALVPLLLVVTASRDPVPFAWPLTVPSWDFDGKTAAGQFAVDLDEGANLRSPDRTLFLYAFSGAQRFGPLPIALVGEDE